VTRRVWFAIAAVGVVAVGVVAFVANGGVSSSGTPGQQLQHWVAATGLGQGIGTLREDGVHVEEVLARHGGTGALRTVCGVLTTDAEAGNSTLPSPNTGITEVLARAYSLDYEAGENCYSAGITGTRLLARSAAERRQAGQLFGQVLARIAVLTGRTVATTTTTVPTTTTGFFG